MRIFLAFALAAFASSLHNHHHKHHHHHHHHHSHSAAQTAEVKKVNTTATALGANVNSTEEALMDKMKQLEAKMDGKDAEASGPVLGCIKVNGPLPTDFPKVFANAVAEATGCDPNSVVVKDTIEDSTPCGAPAPSFVQLSAGASTLKRAEMKVTFEAPSAVVTEVETQSSDFDSKLVQGPLHSYLVADEDPEEPEPAAAAAPVAASPVEIDTEMPYGELEPFGREDTAQELTDQSIQQSDEMVDQLERAEVAEEKRAVFRALTRLRGAAITSFDGIARSQTGNIDEYNHLHKWRETHPLHHLADEESDVSKWAFPDNAD